MSTALVCASHSPLLYCYDKQPDEWDQIQAGFIKVSKFVKEFDPELIIVFGSDHFNGFFLDMMPAFCVGMSATASGDIGGFSGDLDVPADISVALIESLRSNDIDPAVSYRMTIDHAFSQTLVQVAGGLNAVPTIPIFINCITKPFVPFARSRKLGEALGLFTNTLGKRVLLLASGGMSHHPTRYYPMYDEANESMAAWQLSGGKLEQSMSAKEWLALLDRMHHEGVAMITSGKRTAIDMRLNEESDRRFIEVLKSGNLSQFDSWDQNALIEKAGIGSMELHTWIAATAAHMACGGDAPELDLLSIAPEIGISCGIVHA